MTGRHNVNNALAAIAAARHAGISAEVACEALCEFRGVKRRMEKIFESNSLTVYDDFAHHPTAIEETLKGLREKVGNAHITCVIEPRSHTMRGGYHQRRLASSTLSADEIFWFRPKGLEWDMNLIERGEFFDNVDDIIERIATQQLQPESAASPRHVVIMSNGGFDNIHTRLVQRLA